MELTRRSFFATVASAAAACGIARIQFIDEPLAPGVIVPVEQEFVGVPYDPDNPGVAALNRLLLQEEARILYEQGIFTKQQLEHALIKYAV